MRDLLQATIPHLTSEACDKFVAYYELLIDWNTRMNLTAITEPEEVVKKHFYDSLAALPYLHDGERIADVGTGAGFPAIPLLIMNPGLKITLVDSLQKRLTFFGRSEKNTGIIGGDRPCKSRGFRQGPEVSRIV